MSEEARKILERLVAWHDAGNALMDPKSRIIQDARAYLERTKEPEYQWQWRMETAGWQDCNELLASIFARSGIEVRCIAKEVSPSPEAPR